MGRVFHPAQRPVERAPALLFLNLCYTFIVCSVKTSASFRILYHLNNGSVCALYLLFATTPILLL